MHTHKDLGRYLPGRNGGPLWERMGKNCHSGRDWKMDIRPGAGRPLPGAGSTVERGVLRTSAQGKPQGQTGSPPGRNHRPGVEDAAPLRHHAG
jgi:hypothetical protein